MFLSSHTGWLYSHVVDDDLKAYRAVPAARAADGRRVARGEGVCGLCDDGEDAVGGLQAVEVAEARHDDEPDVVRADLVRDAGERPCGVDAALQRCPVAGVVILASSMQYRVFCERIARCALQSNVAVCGAAHKVEEAAREEAIGEGAIFARQRLPPLVMGSTVVRIRSGCSQPLLVHSGVLAGHEGQNSGYGQCGEGQGWS